jgi:hypothetical protein
MILYGEATTRWTQIRITLLNPEDGGCMFLRNVGAYLPNQDRNLGKWSQCDVLFRPLLKIKPDEPITKLEVLTAVTMKSTVFWVVTPCSLEPVRHYRTYRLHL